MSSVFFSDTLGLWGDRILITGGLRLQEIKTTSYSYTDGARTGGYKESAATPVLGLVIKPASGTRGTAGPIPTWPRQYF